MTKQQAKAKLFKDCKITLITAAITFIFLVIAVITDLQDFRSTVFEEGVFLGIIAMPLASLLMGYCVGGFVTGVRWLYGLSKNRVGIILAVIYWILAQPVGMVVLAIYLIRDIFALTKAE